MLVGHRLTLLDNREAPQLWPQHIQTIAAAAAMTMVAFLHRPLLHCTVMSPLDLHALQARIPLNPNPTTRHASLTSPRTRRLLAQLKQ